MTTLSEFIKQLQELEKIHGGEIPVETFDEYSRGTRYEAFANYIPKGTYEKCEHIQIS